MSKIMEYYTAYLYYDFYEGPRYSTNTDVIDNNFKRNMNEFTDVVNECLAEGWILHGAPTFSIDWMCREYNGLAIQAFVREKNVERAVVVEVKPDIIIAENVKGLRSSKRLLHS